MADRIKFLSIDARSGSVVEREACNRTVVLRGEDTTKRSATEPSEIGRERFDGV